MVDKQVVTDCYYIIDITSSDCKIGQEVPIATINKSSTTDISHLTREACYPCYYCYIIVDFDKFASLAD